MNFIEKLSASHKYDVGDCVAFTLNRNTSYECEMTGKIIQVIPYGFAAFYVIEYYAVIDYTLHMEYSTLVRGVDENML